MTLIRGVLSPAVVPRSFHPFITPPPRASSPPPPPLSSLPYSGFAVVRGYLLHLIPLLPERLSFTIDRSAWFQALLFTVIRVERKTEQQVCVRVCAVRAARALPSSEMKPTRMIVISPSPRSPIGRSADPRFCHVGYFTHVGYGRNNSDARVRGVRSRVSLPPPCRRERNDFLRWILPFAITFRCAENAGRFLVSLL